MADQTSRLSVRAILDSGDYARGAAEVARSNKEMAASGQGVVVSLAATDGALSRAGSGAARLARTYVDGARGAAQFQTDLRTLNTALETGKVTAEQASAIYAGMVQRFGLVADGAEIAAQHFRQLGTIIDQTNREMREFAQVSAAIEQAAAELETMTTRAAALRAAIDPLGASQARLNSELSEYSAMLRNGAINAEEFAKAETLARQRHEQFAASLEKTPSGGAIDNNAMFRRTNLGYQAFDVGQSIALGFSPAMIAAQQGPQILQAYMGQQGGALAAVKTDIAAAQAAIGGLVTAIGPVGWAFAGVSAAAGAFYLLTRSQTKTTDEVLKEHAANIKALGDAYGIAEQKAKQYSDTDRAIAEAKARQDASDLALKQKEATKALADQFGYGGDMGRYRASEPFIAFQVPLDQLRRGKITLDEFRQKIDAIGAAPGLEPQRVKIDAAADSLNILNAKAKETEDIFARIATLNLPPLDPLGAFNLDQKQTDRANRIPSMAQQLQQQIDAARLQASALTPQEKAAAARAAAEAQFSEGESSTVRSNRIELAEKTALIGAEQELRQAQADRMRQSQAALAQAQYEVSLIGKSVEERNRLIAAYRAQASLEEEAARRGGSADPNEVAAARAKAAAIADANAKVSLGKMVEDQGYDIQRMQLEANLIGATADQRARATAALEAEIRLKQQGIDTSSSLAQAYIREQEALAHANQEIQRQQAAYQSLQQAQGSVIDDLITGTGTMQDRLKAAASDVLKWVEQMALANPLKNALTGTNLPTLADLFSGKPQVPNLTGTSTPLMNVTASVVNLSGAPIGGLPGFTPSGVPGATTTFSQFLGLGAPAANTNGVRPTLTSNGIVNSPVPLLATANQNTPTNLLAYQNAIKSIESGGRYDIMGPVLKSGDRAYGAYQVMGNNVPSWSEKWYGQRLTPDQFLANRQAQDAVFNGEFGSYVDRYGASGAASKWFTGSATPTGRTDILGTSDNSYVRQFNAALSKTSTNLSSAAKDVSTLGDSSMKAGTSLTDVFSSSGILGKSITPSAPAQLPSNFFPPAPSTGGFNPLSLFTSLFSLFGFADGTDFAPGGPTLVGERGAEIVNLPRGSRVTPTHRLASVGASGGSVSHKHEYNITVSGNGDKDLMRKMTAAADEIARQHVQDFQRNSFNDAMDNYRQYPHERG